MRNCFQSIIVPFWCCFLLTLCPCSSVGPLWAAAPSGNIYLFCHGLLYGLRRNLCSITWSTSLPPKLVLSSWCLQGFFLILSSLWNVISQFLKYIFPEVLLSWLRGSAVPCCGFDGASWTQLCPAQRAPGLSSHKPSLQSLPSIPWHLHSE